MTQKVIFLDRDGTLIEDTNYLSKAEDVVILPTVNEALSLFLKHNYQLIMVTNQSGIGRGYYNEDDFHAVQRYLLDYFSSHNIPFLDYYFCPHHPEKGVGEYRQNCDCRKPNPGMLKQAIDKHSIDAQKSIMIGDKDCDVDAGHALNMKSILVETGKGTQHKEWATADFIAPTLYDAAVWVTQH